MQQKQANASGWPWMLWVSSPSACENQEWTGKQMIYAQTSWNNTSFAFMHWLHRLSLRALLWLLEDCISNCHTLVEAILFGIWKSFHHTTHLKEIIYLICMLLTVSHPSIHKARTAVKHQRHNVQIKSHDITDFGLKNNGMECSSSYKRRILN